MPRNHGRTAILATRTVHSKIRTILGILTILSILQSGLSQKRSPSNKENVKNYLVEWDEAYGSPASLSKFVKGNDNETSDATLSKEKVEGSKERRYSRWWKEKEEEKRRPRQEDLWRKDVNKAGLTVLEGNTVKRTIGKEYLDSRSFRMIEGREEVKENEEETEDRGNNEESSRSKEDRNSNNFMTKPRTPRNRGSETEEDRAKSVERSNGGRRSSWILRGVSIKRSIHKDSTRGELSRKGEMSFSTGNKLDDDVRRAEEEKRRRGRRKRKRRRRETNSSFEDSNERKASNRSVLEKRKVRIDAKEKKGERMKRIGKEKKGEKKEEERKFITTISSRYERQEERQENGNVVESFEENLWKRDEKSNASLGVVVDNFSEDTTLSYLTKEARKSTQRKEDAPNRVGSSKDWYRDNTTLPEKAIGFRSRQETEDKNGMTTSEGNPLRDKISREGKNVDLKPREKNVLVTMQRSGWDNERVSKEFFNSPIPKTLPSGTIKYTRGDEDSIDRRKVTNGNESFSMTTTTLRKNVSQEKEKNREKGMILPSAVPIYFSQERMSLPKDMRGGKEGVSRSVGNISENTVVYRNSTYPNHDTFDSSWVYSTGLPIVESDGRGTESWKDSERNVGDSMESPKLLETSLPPRFPIVPIVRARLPANENSRKEHHRVAQNREKVLPYVGYEVTVKTPRKKYQGVTFDTRDSRMDEKKAEETRTEAISLEYFPRSTSLTNSEITASSRTMERKEEESARKTEDREVSDYEKEINDTAREPARKYKFELRESSTTTLDDIREKLEGNEGREEDRKVERLKGEEKSSNRTILYKSKRSKSIGLTRNGGKISSGNIKEDEKSSVENQETKTDERIDPISYGNVRTSVLRRDTTETTMEGSIERTSTVSSGPLDRSISVTEIEGITSSPPFDVSSQFPSDRFNTILSTPIGEIPSNLSEKHPWNELYNLYIPTLIGPTVDTTIKNPWPVKHSAVVEGDLVLGGLMMVHEREDSITCGPVMPQGGVQALEAMLYTLDMLNQRQIVPGVKIGAHILDDCDKDTYGLEMAVDFIKGT